MVGAYFTSLTHLFLESAPYLLAGLFIAGLLRVFLPEEFLIRHLGGHSLLGAFKAALLGLPLPLCSCGVLPAAVGLYRQGAGLPATFAFLVATPQTSVDAIALAYGLLGGVFAVAYPLSALGAALLVALAITFGTGRRHRETTTPLLSCACCSEQNPHTHTFSEKLVASLRHSVEELFAEIARPLLVGFLLAALVSVLLPPDLARVLSAHGLTYPAMLLLGLPLYLCATASIPLGYALLTKGFSPGSVLIFLMAGPATNVTSLTVLVRVFGKRITILYLVSLILAAFVSGWIFDRLVGGFVPPGKGALEEGPGPVSVLSAGVLGVFFLRELLWKRLFSRKGIS
ncbi:permease [Thermosulfurimonas sp. F29]|uniref:permease n=1 Tax=Thermosulfurimonas sp. F29 TaxID=2867247 RepID=UPI001C83541E|nr:permease [Thermosulfurimonas sp. F29]MBX6423988.1 permease [Thermosulfurimonas sp. F29]